MMFYFNLSEYYLILFIVFKKKGAQWNKILLYYTLSLCYFKTV